MRIGIPRELKPREGRVGLIPAACVELVRGGHEVFVEHGAGEKSGYSDQHYRDVGVDVLPTADELFAKSQMIVKVKEPIEPDLERLRKDHLLFCYLHLAALPELTRRLCDIGLTAVAFETVEDRAGRLPLLAPMSDIAGRLSMQYATTLLHQPQGGKGILLGGVPAARRGRVVVLGAGVAGGNSALVAAGLGAEVIVFDKDRDKLVAARAMGANVTGAVSARVGCRRGRARRRRRHRRGAGHRRACAARGVGRHGAQHAAGQRDRGHQRRSGRLCRNHAADHLRGADLPMGRRHAFLRHQHARRRAAHLVAGAVRRDRAVRRAPGRWPFFEATGATIRDWSRASMWKAARSRIRP